MGQMLEYSLDYSGTNWLSTTLETDVLTAGSFQGYDVLFDATGLYGGTYEAQITLESNDPVNPEVIVPVTLEVEGVPDISLSLESLDFGQQLIDFEYQESFTITNEGTDVLEVSNSDFSINQTTFALAPSTSQNLTIAYNPSIAEVDDIDMIISSNDPDQSAYSVSISAEGLGWPALIVSPAAIEDTLIVESSTEHYLTIDNSEGESPLFFTASLAQQAFNALIPEQLTLNQNNNPIKTYSTKILGKRSTNIEVKGLIGSNLIAITYGDYPDENIQLENTLTSLGYSYVYINSVAEAISIEADMIIGRFSGIDLDVTDLTNWIDEGHGYLQIGDWITWYPTEWFETSGYIDIEIVSDHPITSGLPNSWQEYGFWHYSYGEGGDGYLGYVSDNTFSNIGTGFYSQTSYDRVISADLLGNGRIAYLGFNAYGDNTNSNTEILFANTLGWLLGGSQGWISLDVHEGEINAGDKYDIRVTLDASQIDLGQYNGQISINSNDPINPQFNIPVSLKVVEYEIKEAYLQVHICFGETFFAQGMEQTESGVYYDTLHYESYDSVYVTDLIVQSLIDNSVTNNNSSLTADMENAEYQWLDCANNNQAISGATSRLFNPYESGEYAVRISVNECSVVSECISISNPLSADELSRNLYEVYPNPTAHSILIKLPETVAHGSYKLMDFTGRVVDQSKFENKESITLKIKGTNGVYLLAITDQSNTTTMIKVIKKS